MKRREAEQIGDLIRRAIRAAGSEATYDGHRICYLWPEVVGPAINRFTTARWISRNELHVVISSGPVKNEVAFMADAIINRLNKIAGMSENPRISRLIVH